MAGVADMLGRFRGCLLGALAGDCLGAPFEMDYSVALSVLNNYINKLADPTTKVPYKAYTDDSAMTLAVAQSLIKKKKFDEVDMAKKFVGEYYKAPRRGYGENVVKVFATLKATNFKDVWAPAAVQFDGTGSYGNGGSMRVAPIALFTVRSNVEEMTNMARNSALLTHANPLGYNGAILQCLAVRDALLADSSSFDSKKYVDGLISVFTKLQNPQIEDTEDSPESESRKGFVHKLRVLQDLLGRGDDVSRGEIKETLGNDISAIRSVPTAIYAFLRALQPIDGIESDSGFLRSILFAISLGGDTDTIASMAGAIAGAFHGSQAIPEFLGRHCEAWQAMEDHAEKLHGIVYRGV
ncbi:ADP-ribosylation/Crystallin J1 [Trinorchestia longiramus]|nr:ADP-ribosylation/Crystallin J1 [Trinorchestia longiramus]